MKEQTMNEQTKMECEKALQAMTEAGRAIIALNPKIDAIKVTYADSGDGILATSYIFSAERQWELDEAAKRLARESRERKALRRARGEPEPPEPDWSTIF
jgi:hypothetical protein